MNSRKIILEESQKQLFQEDNTKSLYSNNRDTAIKYKNGRWLVWTSNPEMKAKIHKECPWAVIRMNYKGGLCIEMSHTEYVEELAQDAGITLLPNRKEKHSPIFQTKIIMDDDSFIPKNSKKARKKKGFKELKSVNKGMLSPEERLIQWKCTTKADQSKTQYVNWSEDTKFQWNVRDNIWKCATRNERLLKFIEGLQSEDISQNPDTGGFKLFEIYTSGVLVKLANYAGIQIPDRKVVNKKDDERYQRLEEIYNRAIRNKRKDAIKSYCKRCMGGNKRMILNCWIQQSKKSHKGAACSLAHVFIKDTSDKRIIANTLWSFCSECGEGHCKAALCPLYSYRPGTKLLAGTERKTCICCQKPFMATAGQVKRGTGKYCSRKCQNRKINPLKK